MLEVKFYYNADDNRKIRKTLTDGLTLEGELTESVDISSPTLTVAYDEMPRWNYCYIPYFRRYYYVTETRNVADGLWQFMMTVDPLMSFKRDILSLSVVVDKAAEYTHGDEYIDDGSLIAESYDFSRVINFPNGFLNGPELILITAG